MPIVVLPQNPQTLIISGNNSSTSTNTGALQVVGGVGVGGGMNVGGAFVADSITSGSTTKINPVVNIIGKYGTSSSNTFGFGIASDLGAYSTSAAAGDCVIRTSGGNLYLQTSGTGTGCMKIDNNNNLVVLNKTTCNNNLDVSGYITSTYYVTKPRTDQNITVNPSTGISQVSNNINNYAYRFTGNGTITYVLSVDVSKFEPFLTIDIYRHSPSGVGTSYAKFASANWAGNHPVIQLIPSNIISAVWNSTTSRTDITVNANGINDWNVIVIYITAHGT